MEQAKVNRKYSDVKESFRKRCESMGWSPSEINDFLDIYGEGVYLFIKAYSDEQK